MKNFKFIVLIFILILNSCASIKIKEPDVQGRTYFDQNIPKVKIEFPYDVSFIKQDIKYSDISKVVSRTLYSKEVDATIFINKEKITLDRFVYSGTDDSRIKGKLYSDVDKRRFCTVDFYEEKLQTYLQGCSFRYVGLKEINNVIVYKKIGYVGSLDEYKENNSKAIEDFIEEMKYICSQNIQVKD